MSKLQEKDVMAAEVLQERGWSKRRIARELDVHESTIRYRLKRRRENIPDGRRGQAEACAAHAEVIDAWIREQRESGRKRTGPVKELFEYLVEREGYRGSYKAVLRYVRRRMKKPPVRPIRRVEVRAGTQAQIDWTQETVWVHELGGWVKLSAFIMVLSFSRMWTVVWSLKQDLLSWIHCHNEAFERLGGVPLTGRIDNLKTGVSSGCGPWAVEHPGYGSYARQMGFLINATRVRKPEDKGKVERKARDSHLLLTGADRFSTLADLQAKTDERILRLSMERLCPLTGRRVHETWLEEQAALCPLPPSLPDPFDVEVAVVADSSCLVPFEGRRYQVPLVYRGKGVRIRGCAGRVEIRDPVGKLLVTYPRGTECRILLDQDLYDQEGDGETLPAVPLGRVGRAIVMPKTWEAPRRSIDCYALVAGGGR